ncbi:MAG: NosD domain-containing protein [Candidatus Bathyarchaeia archaeon]
MKIFFVMLALILTSMLTLAFNIQPVRSWTGTVYIRADGSIDPQGAPIITHDNITYTLTDNITSSNDGIIVQKDDIVIDGVGFELSGTGNGIGVDLSDRINVTVKNMTIENFQIGIRLFNSQNNTIHRNSLTSNKFYGVCLENSNNNCIIQNDIEKNRCGICFLNSKNNCIQTNNIIANNESGVYLGSSSLNRIFKNNATNNLYAIFLEFSYNNTIFENNIVNNQYGIWVRQSNNNVFYHNNCIDNSDQFFDPNWEYPYGSSSVNVWDDGYPSGGNYWSNYAGVDYYNGLYQNETGSDGIGDSKFRINSGSGTPPELVQFDNYPLMGMFYDFEVVGLGNEIYHVEVISNSTVSELNLAVWLSSPNEYLQPGQEFLQFYVEGENDTSGFCRITVPRALLNDSYIVLVDWTVVPAYQLDVSNSTHAYLYFAYNHTRHEVIIIPEFTLTLLFLTATLITITPLKAKNIKKQNLHISTLKVPSNQHINISFLLVSPNRKSVIEKI